MVPQAAHVVLLYQYVAHVPPVHAGVRYALITGGQGDSLLVREGHRGAWRRRGVPAGVHERRVDLRLRHGVLRGLKRERTGEFHGNRVDQGCVGHAQESPRARLGRALAEQGLRQ